MIDINDYIQDVVCEYLGETYRVRDNGAIMRCPQQSKPARKKDNIWTLGDTFHNGYMYYGGVPVHRIVCKAFHGPAPTDQYVVDHIDTNRQNNRPENLRWLTKLENILNNEITRSKVEYICGSIEAFLENPSLLFGREQEDSNFKWMRAVSKEEARISLANIKQWLKSPIKSESMSGGKGMGDWVFKENLVQNQLKEVVQNTDSLDSKSAEVHKPWQMSWEEINNALGPKSKEAIVQRNIDFLSSNAELDIPRVKEKEVKETDLYKESLTPNALQGIDWKTPTEFPLCPTDVSGGLDSYLDRLETGKCFSKNKYCASKVVKVAKGNDNNIIVYSKFVSEDESGFEGVKPYALSIIHIVGDKYAHDSERTYFDEMGAEKYFTLLQGKEWTGGDVFDDFC